MKIKQTKILLKKLTKINHKIALLQDLIKYKMNYLSWEKEIEKLLIEKKELSRKLWGEIGNGK